MNIHEYQAKQLFERFNVATPKGAPAETPEQAEKIASALNTSELIIKAQIHAGGRGKGTFTNGFKGGVKLCKTAAEARELASKMLGQTLVTHQTGPTGKVVRKVLIAASVDIEREVYFAILMDRASGVPVVVASTEGGVEIEKVAEEHPEKIMREPVHPLLGLQPYQALKLGRELNFQGDQLKAASKLFLNLYKLFVSLDCSMVEINPLVVTVKGEVLALDAKFNLTITRSIDTKKFSRCGMSMKRILARLRHRSSALIISGWREILPVWSMAPVSPWRLWTSSSMPGANPRTSSMSGAVLANNR
jgi:succinyl-CoA synthetase beta subunit